MSVVGQEFARPPKDLGTRRQEQYPNFMASGKLYLVRCFLCEPVHGQENFAPMVAKGQCAWCGWKWKP